MSAAARVWNVIRVVTTLFALLNASAAGPLRLATASSILSSSASCSVRTRASVYVLYASPHHREQPQHEAEPTEQLATNPDAHLTSPPTASRDSHAVPPLIRYRRRGRRLQWVALECPLRGRRDAGDQE